MPGPAPCSPFFLHPSLKSYKMEAILPAILGYTIYSDAVPRRGGSRLRKGVFAMNVETVTHNAKDAALPAVTIKRSLYYRFIYFMFPIGYAIFGMLAYKCLLVFIALGGVFNAGAYPRLPVFSAVSGFFALAVCAALMAGNGFILYNEVTEKSKSSRIFGEILMTLALCPTFIVFWDKAFAYMQKVF